MPSATPPHALDSPTPAAGTDPRGPFTSRRALLAGSGALALLAAGCGPTGSGAQTPAPTAVATPASASQQALRAATTQEQQLGDWLAALVSGAGRFGIPAATASLLAGLRDAHRAHASLLRQPQFSGDVTSATPTPTTKAPSGAWKQLAQQLTNREQSLASSHQKAALAATDATSALVLCSLHVFAAAQASPTLAVRSGGGSPSLVAPGTRLDALQVLLGRLRALDQGLRTALGQLASSNAWRTTLAARQQQVWTLRDQVIAQVVALGGDPAAPHVGYVMPGGFGTVAAMRHTVGLLEDGLLQAWARVSAASQGADRKTAIGQMDAQAARVVADGVGLTRWPGWA